MNGSDRSAITRRLRELGVRPSKRLGQNFLHCEHVIAAMVDAARSFEPETVIEIGPGLGALTHGLAEVSARVVAVEIDGRLAEELSAATADRASIQVIRGDIRDVRIAAFTGGAQAVVVGSIPYRISADILRWLVRSREAVRGAVLLTQREVAQKILDSPGRRGSALGVFVQAYACPEALQAVPRHCFCPVPEVDSLLWRMTWREVPAFTASEERFFALVRALYGSRRKMLRAALQPARGAGHVAEALSAAGIDGERRGETLTLTELDRLAVAWEDRARIAGKRS
ncbi:MAG: ribosomal RNA small subunit methyltransferase A [Candidatus Bipolaricaulota bacterium]|nr:MAG: ribosomal RNA small subunit methyltransferase A [Candidatus Bipolaricaulota bacterium]